MTGLVLADLLTRATRERAQAFADLADAKAAADAARFEADRYRAVYEWIAENVPRAVELCPYKIDSKGIR